MAAMLPIRALLLLFLILSVSLPSETMMSQTTTTTTTMTTSTEAWKYGDQPSSGLCGSGERQSPINIVRHDVVPDPNSSVTLVNYNAYIPSHASVSFAHDTITIFADDNQPVYLILKHAANVTAIYVLHSLLFHWGDTEHHFPELTDVSYRLEAHLVHYSQEFDSVEEAMYHEHGLCVLAVAFELKVDGENSAIDEVIGISSEQGGTVRWSDLVAPATNYSVYQYSGSMTRSPCLETVIWNVLVPAHSNSLKPSQLDWFQRAHNPPILFNSRSRQSLNDRNVRQIQLVMAESMAVALHGLIMTANKSMRALPPNLTSNRTSNGASNLASKVTTQRQTTVTTIKPPPMTIRHPSIIAIIFSYFPIGIMVALLVMFWYVYHERTAEDRGEY